MDIKDFSDTDEFADMVDKRLKETSVSAVASNDGVMRPEIPEELYDGYAVYRGLDGEAKKYTTPKNVSDVLDSVVRLIKQRIGA